jgi:very-short-patch-repair endonuclease
MSFESVMSNVNKGSWCPYCVNKTETILYERLVSVYPNIQRQFKEDWCKKKRFLPFDYCITEHKIIIELDGRQHFKQVMKWDSPENQFKNDKYKEKCANDNGYSMIRIIQEDVFNNKYDWFKELFEAIDNTINNKKIVNIYMCKNGEYDNL